MERTILNELRKWKQSAHRLPLIINGARQVGKTWILQHFGKTEYKHLAYINFDNRDSRTDSLFQDYNIQRILTLVEAIAKVPVVPEETLIVFDEIQEVPQGLGVLKYFAEDAPGYHVAVAGSLLGIMLHKDASFPVGKVDSLSLYPMSFEEFMIAMDERRALDILRSGDWQLIDSMHGFYMDMLRQYLFVGGMPAAVKACTEQRGVLEVRRLQEQIISNYRMDISKHTTRTEVQRINIIYDSMPAQLARENKKFIYGAAAKGARAREYEGAIQWMEDAGILNRVYAVQKPALPLRFYENRDAFKLYFSDCGLLGAMTHTEPFTLLQNSSVFEEYKGAFVEQFVLQQLRLSGLPIYYYSRENAQMEIDFLLQKGDMLVPIEAKSGNNLKSKSLNQYRQINHPALSVKTSVLPYKRNDDLVNLPLYAVGLLPKMM